MYEKTRKSVLMRRFFLFIESWDTSSTHLTRVRNKSLIMSSFMIICWLYVSIGLLKERAGNSPLLLCLLEVTLLPFHLMLDLRQHRLLVESGGKDGGKDRNWSCFYSFFGCFKCFLDSFSLFCLVFVFLQLVKRILYDCLAVFKLGSETVRICLLL